MEKNYVSMTIRIDSPLYEKLNTIANAEDRSIAKTILHAVRHYVSEYNIALCDKMIADYERK